MPNGMHHSLFSALKVNPYVENPIEHLYYRDRTKSIHIILSINQNTKNIYHFFSKIINTKKINITV